MTQPDGIPNFLRVMVAFAGIALVMDWLNIPQLAFVAQLASLLVIIFEFVLYYRLYDDLFPDKEGKNVYGVINPEEEVRNMVIFSGHHDSARIYNFFCDYPDMFMVREAIFLISQVIHLIYLTYLNFHKLCNGSVFRCEDRPASYRYMTIFFTLVYPLIAWFWFFLSNEGTVGAGDNLIASVMGMTLAKYYQRHRPKHTRLMFLSFDAEEIALRGSRIFFTRHAKEFHEVKTWNFNVDCPYYVCDLKFLTSDVNGFVGLSPKLANKCVSIAHDLGYSEARSSGIMFLGGGTDAGMASRWANIEATTLIAMPFGPRSKNGKRVPYHQPIDTVDQIEPGIVEATFRIFTKLIDDMDHGHFT
jgi:hypothetical protein